MSRADALVYMCLEWIQVESTLECRLNNEGIPFLLLPGKTNDSQPSAYDELHAEDVLVICLHPYSNHSVFH